MKFEKATEPLNDFVQLHLVDRLTSIKPYVFPGKYDFVAIHLRRVVDIGWLVPPEWHILPTILSRQVSCSEVCMTEC